MTTLANIRLLAATLALGTLVLGCGAVAPGEPEDVDGPVGSAQSAFTAGLILYPEANSGGEAVVCARLNDADAREAPGGVGAPVARRVVDDDDLVWNGRGRRLERGEAPLEIRPRVIAHDDD